ncbi:MAG: DoxX family protein [Gordonia sp. (in: high G+C Gram-positive bacteria)]
MSTIRPIVLLLARAALGAIFILHGWQKMHIWGIDATAATFAKLGVPYAENAARGAAWGELVGGILLIIGLALPLVSLVLVGDMAASIYFSHFEAGFWNTDGGWEWPLGLIAALLAVGYANSGGYSADHYLMRGFGGG